MRFCVWPSTGRPWPEILEMARHAEAAGWHGLYLADHFMPHGNLADPALDQTEPLDGDRLECWSVLAGLATTVPRIKLGTLVSSVTYRHPAVLANIAAAVDNMSEGRVVLGIGAGWQINEHGSYGIPLPPVAERLDRFEEACAVLQGLLTQKRTTFEGRYYRLDDAPNQPTPVQARLPILIGGGGEKRTLRIAAQYADAWNTWATPDVLAHKLGVLRGHCEAVGRDPAEIAVSTQQLGGLGQSADEIVDTVARFREVGADEIVMPDQPIEVSAWKDEADRLIELVGGSA